MNTLDKSRTLTRKSQRGVVLVISLLLLLVLTLIGLAATRSTTLEERMTANQRDQDVAFQAAEAALRDGESALQSAAPGQFNNTNGYYDSSSTVTYTDQSVWDSSTTNSIVYSGTLTPAPSEAPRYYLVQSASSGPSNGTSLAADAPTTTPTVYLVFAKGYGLSPNTVVYLESAYQR